MLKLGADSEVVPKDSFNNLLYWSCIHLCWRRRVRDNCSFRACEQKERHRLVRSLVWCSCREGLGWFLFPPPFLEVAFHRMVLSFCTRIKQLAEMINNILIFWPGLGCRNVEVLWPPGSLRILSQPLVLGGQPAIPSFWESCLFITCTLRVRAPLFQISPPFCTLLLDLSSAVCVCCAPVAGWTAGPETGEQSSRGTGGRQTQVHSSWISDNFLLCPLLTLDS